MSEDAAAILFLVALPAGQALSFLLCQILWRRDAARERLEVGGE